MPRLARFAPILLAAVAGAACGGQSPAVADAQSHDRPADSQPALYWLRVTADRVSLRSRADRNSVIIDRLERDAVLQAVGSEFGWHRVQPPEGVYSYVSARFVDQISSEEGIVSVRSGNLRVRVGSLITEVDPLKSEVQALLPRGTAVRILGRQGDWLRIVPPTGVWAYVSGDCVEKITPAVAARLQAAAATQPSSAEAAARKTADEGTADPDLSGPWGQRLRLVEAAIAAEGRKPPLKQSWTGSIGQLRPISAQRDEPVVARLAQQWLTLLEQRTAAQSALRSAEAIARRQGRGRAQFEREMEQIRQARRAASRPAFVAQGQLLRGADLPGVRSPRRFKLQDPITRDLVAYVIFPAAGPASPEPFVGKYVGVRGARTFDQALGAAVIRVSEIESLEQTSRDASPARRNP